MTGEYKLPAPLYPLELDLLIYIALTARIAASKEIRRDDTR